jgi:rhodanese-related sulfurtransferase
MSNALRAAVFAVAWLALAAPSLATDAASVAEAKRTTLGLYLTSEEVPPFLAQRGGHSLFIDVRAPEELASSGVATPVDANVPLLLQSSGDGRLQPNPDFVAQVKVRLAAKGLTTDDAVVVMCRTGRRSALAASLLAAFGFTHVYSVIDGFEGDEPGAGWKSKGLPWRPITAAPQPN